MPLITLDTKELRALARDMKHSDMRMAARARQAVKRVSFALEKRVKQEMPVDTGRARASWGHGGKQEGDSVWIEMDGGLVIVQGSNVPYIEALNSGHSQQAPAGFIDTAHRDAEQRLEEELGFIDVLREFEVSLGVDE